MSKLILLPGTKDGAYPDLYLSINKIGYSLQNTAVEKNGAEYVGNRSWEQALILNLTLGKLFDKQQSTPNLREFHDFASLLYENKDRKHTNVYDENGKRVDSRLCKRIFDEIFEVRKPGRGEWIDGKVEKKEGIFYLLSNHKIEDLNGKLIATYNQPLDSDCLTKPKEIDLIAWFKGACTPQGLPNRFIAEGNLPFTFSAFVEENTVVRLGACSFGFRVGCGRDPQDSDFAFGVRAKILKD